MSQNNNSRQQGLENAILQKKTEFLYTDFYIRIAAFSTTSLVIYFVAKEVIAAQYVSAWLYAGISLIAFRALCQTLYQLSQKKEEYSIAWQKVYFANALLTGIFFGSSSFSVVLTSEEMHILTMAIIVFAYNLAVMNSSVAHLPSFYAFMLPSTIPVIVSFFVSDIELLRDKLSILAILFVLVFFLIAKGNGRIYNELLRLRFRLEKQKQVAESANFEKSRFLAAASHDLRQPLNTISITVGVLEQLKLENHIKQLVFGAKRAVESMANMFNTLLDISKLDAGTVKPNKSH